MAQTRFLLIAALVALAGCGGTNTPECPWDLKLCNTEWRYEVRTAAGVDTAFGVVRSVYQGYGHNDHWYRRLADSSLVHVVGDLTAREWLVAR